MTTFKSKLESQYKKFKSNVCIGIDPHIKNLLPSFFTSELSKLNDSGFLSSFSAHAIKAAKDKLGCVKFQSAFFEQFGDKGYTSLKSSMSFANQIGMISILDAKRGDIASTMAAYGDFAYFQMGADALTVNTYLGTDTLEALLPWLKNGKGAYVVLLSSNKSGQQLQLARLASNQTLAEYHYDIVKNFAVKHNVEDNIGFVVGASYFCSEKPLPILEQLKNDVLLIPGMGAQGTTFADIKNPTFYKPWNLIPMSRSLCLLGEQPPAKKFLSITEWDEFSFLVKERIEDVVSATPQP